MESLAMAAAIIMLGIVLCGVLATVVLLRRPRSGAGRVVATVVSVPAVLAGGWLWSLDIGTGARMIGFVVLVTGAGALWRTWRQVREQ